jgi:hypothetical protein
MRRAISQVKVDEALVWDANLLGNAFEVANRVFIQPNGDLLFQLGCVRVFARFGEIVFFSHCASLTGVACDKQAMAG